MFSYADLQSLICDSFSPIIAIESSKSAEQTCRDTGMSVIQLLRYFVLLIFSYCRPFAHKEDVNFTIQFESRSVTIEQIHLDLEYSAFINHMDPDEIEEELLESVSEKEPSKEDIQKIIAELGKQDAKVDIVQPWLLDYLSSLFDCCRYGDSDCLCHPLAVILVVSSTDPDPIRRFDELSQRILNKREFKQGMYSKSIPFYYFLLHNVSSHVNAENIYHNMKASFNASLCKIIRINSLSPEQSRDSPPFEFQRYFP